MHGHRIDRRLFAGPPSIHLRLVIRLQALEVGGLCGFFMRGLQFIVTRLPGLPSGKTYKYLKNPKETDGS